MTEEATVTIPVRVIRSFPHRNIRNIVMKEVSLNITTEQMIENILTEVKTSTVLPPPFRLVQPGLCPPHSQSNCSRKFGYDSLKIEHHAHGSKTSDPVISTEDDESLILQAGRSLGDQGLRNETELSLFRMEDYLQYKQLPVHGQTQW